MDIDVVYTWVDGADQEFIKSISDNIPDYASKKKIIASQYRDLKELYYSIRAIRQYMPWIRKIFIVTNGQVPQYIDLSNSQIEIIHHEQIFVNTKNLPVFSSLAIECNLHRIPGLAEVFIYLNNDFFVARPMERNDFISDDLRETFLLEARQIKSSDEAVSEDQYGKLLSHNSDLISAIFGKYTRFSSAHTPQIFIKSKCVEIEHQFRHQFEFTETQKLRTPSCAFFRLLYMYTRVYQDYGVDHIHAILAKSQKRVRVADRNDFRHITLGDKNTNLPRELEAVKNDKPAFFCLQDQIWDNSEQIEKAVIECLEALFPA